MTHTIVGYSGSLIILLHLLHHLWKTAISRQRSSAGLIDMLVYLSGMILLEFYAIKDRNYPFVLFLAVAITWGILGVLQYARGKRTHSSSRIRS